MIRKDVGNTIQLYC